MGESYNREEAAGANILHGGIHSREWAEAAGIMRWESNNREGAMVARIVHGGIHSFITEKGPHPPG